MTKYCCRYDPSRTCISDKEVMVISNLDDCRNCIEMQKVKVLGTIRDELYLLNRIGNVECGLKALAKAIKEKLKP